VTFTFRKFYQKPQGKSAKNDLKKRFHVVCNIMFYLMSHGACGVYLSLFLSNAA